jgi:hypothetical protein
MENVNATPIEMLGKMERGMGTAINRQHFSVNKLTIYHITEYEDKIKQNVIHPNSCYKKLCSEEVNVFWKLPNQQDKMSDIFMFVHKVPGNIS